MNTAKSNKPRQVVLMMTDTQRKDMLSCYADTGLKTPCLDKLAGQGMKFDRAYCAQPVCGPARAALFTGIYPHNAGSWANSVPLGDNIKTIGQRLSDGGVHAAYIGKWHLDGSDYFGLGRCPSGWDPDYWYDMRNYLNELSPEDRLRSRKPATNRENIAAEFTFGHRCSNRAIDFVERHRDEDFFLVVSYDEPHHPFLCPEPFASMYEGYEFPKNPAHFDDLSDKPEQHRVWSGDFCGLSREDKAAWTRPDLEDFFACNSFVDSEIGRVVASIDQHCPGALVVYTSDHGDCLGEHSMWSKGPMMYDGITNVPLLVRWPDRTPADTVCRHPVSHIDVMPTVLDYFDLPRSGVLDGQSLMSCLKDPGARVNGEVFVEFGRYEVDHDGFNGFQPIRCAYDGRFKLVINLLTTDEFYDLQEDPHELVNRIEDPACTDVRDRLHDRLIDWMNRSRDPFRGYYWLNRPWRTDAPPPSMAFTGMTRQREEDLTYEPRQLDYATGLPMVNATREK
jgi:uncharacterized sulfatase